MNHFLNGIEVHVVDRLEKPEGAWPENFAKEKDERGEVEYEDHPTEPVQEGARARADLKLQETIVDGHRAFIQYA